MVRAAPSTIWPTLKGMESLIHSTNITSGMLAHTCNPTMGEAEARG